MTPPARLDPMTTPTRDAHPRRWVPAFLAAVLAVVLGVLGAGPASAATATAAQNGVGAFSSAAQVVVGASAGVVAGQRLGNSPVLPQIVVATGVAANTAGGAGPVAQGAAGVERTVADLEAAGGRVIGREISADVNGVRTRPDLFA